MESNKKNTISLKYVLIGLTVVVLVLAAISGYFYVQYQNLKKNPEQITKAENEALVEEVGKIYALPKDETPTIATVIDKEKLKDQPFFANAQNGDKILIYTKSKKAIIYRPKEKVIVNAGPIALDQKSLTQVALVNTGGDMAAAEKKISEKFGDTVAILTKTDAKNRNSVKKITVVDVNGQNADAVKQIASELGGDVGSLPSGETAPEGSAIVVFVK